MRCARLAGRTITAAAAVARINGTGTTDTGCRIIRLTVAAAVREAGLSRTAVAVSANDRLGAVALRSAACSAGAGARSCLGTGRAGRATVISKTLASLLGTDMVRTNLAAAAIAAAAAISCISNS